MFKFGSMMSHRSIRSCYIKKYIKLIFLECYCSIFSLFHHLICCNPGTTFLFFPFVTFFSSCLYSHMYRDFGLPILIRVCLYTTCILFTCVCVVIYVCLYVLPCFERICVYKACSASCCFDLIVSMSNKSILFSLNLA